MKKEKFIGFGTRFIAYLIDTIIFFFFSAILQYLISYSDLNFIVAIIVSSLVSGLSYLAYEVLMVHNYGGTVGKILMKIKIIDKDGNFLSIWHAVGRYFSKIVSSLTLGIGYLMILWDPERQGLHDKIANTHVVENNKIILSEKTKKIIAIAAVTIIVCYYLYQIILSIFGFFVGSHVGLHWIDSDDHLVEIDSNCEFKLPNFRDLCIVFYATEDETIKTLPVAERLDVCNLISSNKLHAECITGLAQESYDPEICLLARSRYHQKQCTKAVQLSQTIIDLFGIME